MLTPADIEAAARQLRAGGIVAFPTDTFYGLAVDPRLPDAVARLFAVKKRDQGQALPLIAADVAQARRAATFDPLSERLARAFWPGPLSLVLDGSPALAAAMLAADGSVAVRVPDCASARALAAALGFCITATSANLSGAPPATSASAVAEALGDRIDLVLAGEDAPGGPPSTIVDLRGAAPRLVRAGAIAWDRVLRSIE